MVAIDLNDLADWVPIFLNGMSLIVLVIYSYLTYRIVRVNQRTVKVMEAQIAASIRPYVFFEIVPYGISLEARLRNTGKTAAHNVAVQTNPQLRHVIRGESSPANLTHHTTTHLVPGSSRVEYLGSWTDVQATCGELVFKGEIRYADDAGNGYVEPFTLDLASSGGTPYIGKTNPDEQLKLIAESLQRVEATLRNSTADGAYLLVRTISEATFQKKQERERRAFVQSVQRAHARKLPLVLNVLFWVLGLLSSLPGRREYRDRR